MTIRSCFSVVVRANSLPHYSVICSVLHLKCRNTMFFPPCILVPLQDRIFLFTLNMDPMSSLKIQSWTFYAVAVVIVFPRLVFRRIMLKSFASLQADDWIMVFLLLPFTAAIVLMDLAADPKTTNNRVYRYVLEELHIIITWLVKSCLLILYWRILYVERLQKGATFTDASSPVAFSTLRRRYVQVVSVVCVVSFIVIQVSLLSACQPSDLSGLQCLTYQSHTIVSLTTDTLTTVLVLILPTPFIPTPRRLLLTILMIIGVMALIFGTLARYYILTASAPQTHVLYYIYETTILIVFANLPFLTSLVVSTTPARIREFGRNISFSRDGVHLPLSPWPRSSRMTVQDIGSPLPKVHGPGNTALLTSKPLDKREWLASAPVTRLGSVKCGNETLSRSSSGSGWPLA